MRQYVRKMIVITGGFLCVVAIVLLLFGMTNVKASDSSSITIEEGASVRLVEDSSGIRFRGEISKEYLAQLENDSNVSKVTYGIIIIPTFYLKGQSDFTIENSPCFKIQAVKTIEHDNTYEFRCAMIGLREETYSWEFAARSYVEIIYKDQSVQHIYSSFDEDKNVRSIRRVARATLADESREYTNTELQVLEKYIWTGVSERVYVSSSGNDKNLGTENSPYATLSHALDFVADNGVIVIKDNCKVSSDFKWKNDNKTISIVGDDDEAVEILDFTKVAGYISIGDNVTFDNIKLNFITNTTVVANGHSLVIEEKVISDNPIILYGGGHGNTVASTNLIVKAGNYYRIYGGSYQGIVEGDSVVSVGGAVNSIADPYSHTGTYNVYGGGYSDVVKGNTYVTFLDNAQANYVFGGSDGTGTVNGTNVVFSGGKIMSLYGGNYKSTGIKSVNISVTGGEIQQLFGANQNAGMTGDVIIDLRGGKITRRIYGGCYNEVSSSATWSSEYYVNGTINLKIATGVTISLDATDSSGSKYNDLSIYACSRYGSKKGGENCTITFQDANAYSTYNSKLGAQDFAMKMIMISVNNYYTLVKSY